MKNALFQILAIVTFVIFLGTPRFLGSLVAIPLVVFCIISMYRSEPRKWLSVIILILTGWLWMDPGTSSARVEQADYKSDEEIEAEYIKNFVKVGDYKLEMESRPYMHIKGRIKNAGDKSLSYYKLTAFFKNNNGEIINSEYTNSGDLLLPNASDEYDISVKWSDEYKGLNLVVEEISFSR